MPQQGITILQKPFTTLLLFVCLTLVTYGQTKSDIVQPRILILLDESSSMVQTWAGNKQKNIAAREIILKIMDSIYAVNPDVEFSLRVFGHQYTVKENNCFDTKNEVNFTKSNRTQMELRLNDIHPLGVTPIAYSLKEAAEKDLIDETHYAYSLILLTDGGESCGGDLCAVMRNLIREKVYFKPYIIGLEDVPELRSTYTCMGNFLSVTKETEVVPAVSKIVEAFRPMFKINKKDFGEIKINAKNNPDLFKDESLTIKPKVEPQPMKIIKETPPEPKKIILPATPAIVHLMPADLKIPESIFSFKDKRRTYLIPKPPEDEKMPITIPMVENIVHVTMADLKQPEGKNSSPSPVKTITPPNVKILLPVVPQVPEIVHIVPAPLKQNEIEFTPPTPLKLKKLDIPVIKDIEIPAVNTISHIVPAGLQYKDIATPEMEHIKLVKTGLPVIKDLDIPTVAAISHIVPARLKYADNAIPEMEPIRLAKTGLPVINDLELPAVAIVTHIVPAKLKQIEMPVSSIVPLGLVKRNLQEIEIKDAPTLPLVSVVSHISPAKLKQGTIDLPVITSISPKKIDLNPIEIKDPPVLPTAGKIGRLRPAKTIEPKVIFIIEDHVLKLREAPPAPVIATPIVRNEPPKIVPPPKKAEPDISTGYTVETEEAKETSLLVYFTNGHGKFYSSMPQVVLIDPISNNVVKKFYRTLDPNGEPDAQKDIAPGKYNFAVADKKNLVLHDVEITAGKVNKVIVKIKNCSLEFAYEDAPNRPVKEFTAVVIERNTPNGKEIRQKCTQKLEYEPGNYHILVETYPDDKRNVDLDFNASKVITLKQPGWVRFNCELKSKKLNLYRTLGDKFFQFDTRNVSDTALRHLQIQPGQYQVRFVKDPTKPYQKEVVIPFAVRPTEETVVEIPTN